MACAVNMGISLIRAREMTKKIEQKKRHIYWSVSVSCGDVIKCGGFCFILDDRNTVLVINGREW